MSVKDIGEAVQRAAGNLPQGYTINIVLERDSGVVVLYDDEGEECEFPSNHESLAETINDAVEFAIADEKVIEQMRDRENESGPAND